MKVEALNSSTRITIMRVANGWVVAGADEVHRGGFAWPQAVAETPAALADMVVEWAEQLEKANA